MLKKTRLILFIVIWISSIPVSSAQCPTNPARGFQIFVEKNATLTALQSEGAVAIGEDLTINGNYQLAVKSPGSFWVNNSLIALLVNGKVNYRSGNVLQINNGYVKIGNLENANVWLTDDKGTYTNEQICNGSFNSTARIQLLNPSKNLNISESKKEVEDTDLIDFGKAIETMRASSKSLAAKANNVSLTDLNGNAILPNKFPSRVMLSLHAGNNYLTINGQDLNAIAEISFNTKPDAGHVLVINIDAKDIFNWQVFQQHGVGIVESPFILYNFFNTSTLNIEGSNPIEGTVFATNADINKKKNNAAIEGQIIGISFNQELGENHLANFDADAEELGCKKPVVAAITGNNSVCIGLKTILSSETEGGVWTSSANNIATVNASGIVTGISKGNFNINYSLTNNCGTTTVSASMLSNDFAPVNSGNTGGLESKSLGDIVAKRLYQAFTNGEGQMKPYSQLPVLKQELISKQVTGLGVAINLLDLFPKQLSNPAITPYITTPTDIISFTNAKAVASSDYTLNGSCKAVVFATRTQSVMYDHTKAVCDRLKGASIQNIEKIKLLGFDLLRYNMLYEDGHQEHIISFSAGTKTGRNSISIQSNWLKNDYVAEDELYNFQVWGVSKEILGELAEKILTQLSTIAALDQPFSIKDLPQTYIMGARVNQGAISMNLHNTNPVGTGYFEIYENANEQSTITTKKTIPFNLNATGYSTIQLPATDHYESTIKMYLKDSLVDEIFISDGAWNVDYVPTNTVVSKFEIKNDPSRTFDDDYPLLRNIHLEASTNSYISAYKLLRGGGISKDLSGFQTLKFSASGNAVLNITLVKNSIKNWKDQYAIQIPISGESKEYMIDVKDFISSGSKDKIQLNDINSIVFTMGTINGAMMNIVLNLNNLSFSKETHSYLESLKSKSIQVYPNPTSGKFNCMLSAEKNADANLEITDLFSGKKILSKSILLVKGENKIPIDITAVYQNTAGGTCVISIQNADANYEPKKLMIKPN